MARNKKDSAVAAAIVANNEALSTKVADIAAKGEATIAQAMSFATEAGLVAPDPIKIVIADGPTVEKHLQQIEEMVQHTTPEVRATVRSLTAKIRTLI